MAVGAADNDFVDAFITAFISTFQLLLVGLPLVIVFSILYKKACRNSNVIASSNDRKVLKRIGQSESLIVSWITGEVRSFTVSEFDI